MGPLFWFVAAASLALLELAAGELTLLMLGAGVGRRQRLLMLAAVRPVALRHLRKDTGAGASYLDTLPGRRVAAQGAITGDAGTLAVDGDTWSARVEPGAPDVAPGDEVTVLRIDGATLVVRPLPRIDWEADGA